jgi:hypothetical protein
LNDSGLFYLLDDGEIDVEREKERCARNDFKILANETHPERRRLFLGSLLADDSMEVLRAMGTEVYNIFHTVSFVESNTTQSLTPRKWKYYDPTDPPDDLIALHRLFGPRTRVSVEYYVSSLKETFGIYNLGVEYVQREGSTHRWAFNGMRGDDVGIISDTDEVFTRDFLRAMQICDVPEFRPNQDCLNPKVIASTMVFESSPDCVTKDRRWHHPDAILGECVDQVGDPLLHPPGKREHEERHGMRLDGYGRNGDYSKYMWQKVWGLTIRTLYGTQVIFEIKLEGCSLARRMAHRPAIISTTFSTVRMISGSSITRMGMHRMMPWTSQYGSYKMIYN